MTVSLGVAVALALMPTSILDVNVTAFLSAIGFNVTNAFHVTPPPVIPLKLKPDVSQSVPIEPGSVDETGMFWGPPNFPFAPQTALPTPKSAGVSTPTKTN